MKNNIILILIIIFSSCNHITTKDSIIIETEYFENGRIKTQKPIIKHTNIIHGFLIHYHPNGIIKQILQYKNGKKDGIDKGFYENGKIKYKGNNKFDLTDSFTTWYYENGIVKAKYTWSHGKLFGEQYKYSEDGKIAEYWFNDIDEITLFDCKYKKSGDIDGFQGVPICGLFEKTN